MICFLKVNITPLPIKRGQLSLILVDKVSRGAARGCIAKWMGFNTQSKLITVTEVSECVKHLLGIFQRVKQERGIR